jgi:hypothetical protein
MIPGLLPKPDEDIRSPVLRGTSPPAEAGSSVLNRNYPTISKDWIPTCVGMTDLLFALLLETWFGQQAVPPHPPRYGSTATPHAHPRIARVVDWINCNPTCTSQYCAGCRLDQLQPHMHIPVLCGLSIGSTATPHAHPRIARVVDWPRAKAREAERSAPAKGRRQSAILGGVGGLAPHVFKKRPLIHY